MTKRQRRRLGFAIGGGLLVMHGIVRAVHGAPSSMAMTAWELVGILAGTLMLVASLTTVLWYIDTRRGGLTSQQEDAHAAIPGAILFLLAGLGLSVGITAYVIGEAQALRQRRSPLELVNPLDLPEPLRPRMER